ncbi:TetR/AcrR family transcriptional regulator [Sporomusa sp.]|uniref:TetR/AcrR family transcriptional regulator n=1 Tax=Sporomusa sp. TaxID=2078658 RepID=UPI002B6416CA|nr:TetR/AcrR family transcriptional regulator [Sporomusa sp.]HWR08253.1 TetR/AcrR family transcriptional regulator [Sporomusa sp.]
MRNQIIAAAIEDINKFGIKFTMSDLVKRLSISKSTLYAHFKSKEEVIGAIVDLALASLRQQRQDILENNTLHVPEKLKAVLLAHPPMDVSMGFMFDLKRHFPEEWNKIQQSRNEKWEIIESLITQGIEAGYFRAIDSLDLTILRIIFDATTKELMDQSFSVNNSISFTDSMHKIADVLCRSIMKTNTADEA